MEEREEVTDEHGKAKSHECHPVRSPLFYSVDLLLRCASRLTYARGRRRKDQGE